MLRPGRNNSALLRIHSGRHFFVNTTRNQIFLFCWKGLIAAVFETGCIFARWLGEESDPRYPPVELFLSELFCWQGRKWVFAYAVFSTVDGRVTLSHLCPETHKQKEKYVQIRSLFSPIPFLSHVESSVIKEAPDVVLHLSPFTISWHYCESGPE